MGWISLTRINGADEKRTMTILKNVSWCFRVFIYIYFFFFLHYYELWKIFSKIYIFICIYNWRTYFHHVGGTIRSIFVSFCYFQTRQRIGRMLVTTDVRYSRGTRVSKLQQDIELVETEVCSSSKSAVCVRGNRTDELVLATSCVDYFVLMVSRSVCTEIRVSCRKLEFLDSKHVAKFCWTISHTSFLYFPFLFLSSLN